MGSENEPAKLLLPYLQRADELQKHEPLVAYYCRLYAMERGLKIPQSDRTKTTNALLVSLMKQLEKDKKSLKLGPDDHLHVEGFALNVFTKADKQDRAGRADLNTAKTFYAASIFFEILNQFGEIQPDLEQKQKYAAWKAADIRKAVKEGRKPLPGPPGGDNDLSVPSSKSAGEYDLEPSRSDFAPEPDSTREDPSAIVSPRSDSYPHQPYNQDNFQHPTNISPHSDSSPHQPYNEDNFQHPTNISPRSDSSPHQPYNQDNFQHPTNISPHHSNVTPSTSPSISQTPIYPTDNYPSDNFHQPPSTNIPENSIYHQSYQHQPYQPDPEQHFPQNYPSHDVPSYSFPNFHSYPSFTETSLPTAPSHHPSYHQVSNASPANSLPSNTAAHPSTAQYNSSARNGNVQEASPHTAEKYEYDSNYQPPPEKIAEAHKAARFAVGALAFDDVSTAVDYLKKSLELLTNPSSGH
ncbi:hypothetical protein BUALT_Bualt03G0111700 [Buddleja alternifolia]|uniref:Uncharacterized protein n=1 Tax=Buddleja alternifolia TaxID=168488 RepID=A0AAV6Y3M1_9LAMI|nr:hypothetical protein BUALT_Bualt03G0111700 [Buddleja alternifolia]